MVGYWLLDAEIEKIGGILAFEFEMYSCWLLDTEIEKCGGILAVVVRMVGYWLLDCGLCLLAPLREIIACFLLSTFDF